MFFCWKPLRYVKEVQFLTNAKPVLSLEKCNGVIMTLSVKLSLPNLAHVLILGKSTLVPSLVVLA